MSAVRLAIPSLLLLYFVYRSLRQRIFLLGIPFLMFMGNSVFFEKAKIFWVPARLDPADHVMLWLTVVWVISFDLLLPRRSRSDNDAAPFGSRLSPPEEVALLGFAGLMLLEIVLTVVRLGDFIGTLDAAKGWLYVIVGYFLLRGMLCRAGRTDTLEFIESLVLVNTLAAVLFIAHQGFGLRVYQAIEYLTIGFGGVQLTRSFYFMPQLLILAVAYCIARRSWSARWVAVFLVTLGALWVSYTRSLLLIAVVTVAVILGVRLLKPGEAGPALRRLVVIVALALIFVFGALVVLPVQSRYLAARLGIVAVAGTTTANEDNLSVRADIVRTVDRWIAAPGRALGAGFGSRSRDPYYDMVRELGSDLVWVPLLYRVGVVGIIVFTALFAAAIWRALRLSLTAVDDAEVMALMLLGVVMGVFLQGFVSWTVLDPWRYPMGLWFLALLAAETCRRRSETEGVTDG